MQNIIKGASEIISFIFPYKMSKRKTDGDISFSLIWGRNCRETPNCKQNKHVKDSKMCEAWKRKTKHTLSFKYLAASPLLVEILIIVHILFFMHSNQWFIKLCAVTRHVNTIWLIIESCVYCKKILHIVNMVFQQFLHCFFRQIFYSPRFSLQILI